MSITFIQLTDWIEAAFLAAMAPLFIFPSIGRLWPLLVFPVLWIGRILMRHTSRPGSPIDAAILLLFVQLLVSLVVVGDWAAMLPKFMGILYGMLVFFSVVRLLQTERLVAAGIGIFLGGGVVLTIIGLLGINVGGEPHFQKYIGAIFDKLPSVNWNFEGAEAGLNQNAVAGVMLLFVPLSFGLLFESFQSKKISIPDCPEDIKKIENRIERGQKFIWKPKTATKLLLGTLSFFFLFVLFLTQTISSWLALVGGLLLFLKSRNLLIVGILVFVVFMGLVLYVIPESDVEASAEREKPYWIKKISDRHQYWSIGIASVRERSFTGVGVNMLRQRQGLRYEQAHAHNHMLHTAAEIGIPGLIAYLALLVGAWGMCRSVWRRVGGAVWMRAAAKGLAAGQAAHFIFGFGDSIPLGAKPGIFFWVSLGLIAALFNLHIKLSKGR